LIVLRCRYPEDGTPFQGWGVYPPDMVEVLEAARREGDGAAVLVSAIDKPFSYIVDLTTMEQENTSTGKVRNVVRHIVSDNEPEPESDGTDATLAATNTASVAEDDDDDDDDVCGICYTYPPWYSICRACDQHKYCPECIKGTLNAALTAAQFPCKCPECDDECDEESLSFLHSRGVVDAEFCFRFLQQQGGNQEKTFKCPAAGCNRHLLVQPPQFDTTSGQSLLKMCECPGCSARVCVLCHQEETMAVHKCPVLDAARKQASEKDKGVNINAVDDATMQTLKKIGKKCPACGMFIEKNAGCHVMNCGAHAHASMEQGLAGGGCGAEFDWNTMKALKHGSPGNPANERQILYGKYTGSKKAKVNNWGSSVDLKSDKEVLAAAGLLADQPT
jgi:hypothetical protein